MILGISCGGRADGQTAKMVQKVLTETGMETEFISLALKNIGGCRGCLKCAVGDGKCRLKDDFNAVAEKMKQADAIVLGAPAYTFNINVLGHALLERTFALRHGRFYLSGKPAVVVSPGGIENPAQTYMRKMLNHNKMVIVDEVVGECSIAPCYHCGFGHACYAGCVVKNNNGQVVEKITPDMIPIPVAQSKEKQRELQQAAGKLRLIVTKKANAI